MKHSAKRMKETKTGPMVKKLGCFAAGIVFAIALLANFHTSAWFSSSATASAQFGTATTETILEKLEIPEVDPGTMKIKKAREFTSNPIIYFSVGGEAANYILHINPVVLNSFEEEEIKLEPDLNLIQYLKLLFSRPDRVVEGKIRIKYLNEFIDEEKEIKLTRAYLLNRYYAEIERDEEEQLKLMAAKGNNGIFSSEETVTEETDLHIISLVNYVAGQRQWEEAQWLYEMTVEEDSEPLIKELGLTEQQNVLLDLIAPKLRELVASLITQLNEKIALIAEQAAEIQSLNDTNLQLRDEKTKLEEENQKLQEKIEQLTKDVEALNLENYYLTQEVLNIRQALFAVPTGGRSPGAGTEEEQGAGTDENEEDTEQEDTNGDSDPAGEDLGGSGEHVGEEPGGSSGPTGEETSGNGDPTADDESGEGTGSESGAGTNSGELAE